MDNRYILLIFASLIALLILSKIADTTTAIKGGYILVALTIASLYHSEITLHTPNISANKVNITKISLSLLLISFSAILFGVSRRVAIFFMGIVIVPLVIIQIHTGANRVAILFQIIILGTTIHLDKFLSNGFYFGRTDLALHVAGVSSIINQGSIGYIRFVNYDQIPIYHSLAAELSILAGVTSYKSVIILSTICLFLIIISTYKIVSLSSFWRDMPLYYVLFIISTFPIMYFSTYFIPQTLAITFLVIAYLAYTLNSYVYILIIGTTILTHHLTLVLVLPLFSILILYHSYQYKKRNAFIIGIISYVSAISYWAIIERGFIFVFSVFITNISIFSSGVDTGSILRYGLPPSEATIVSAIYSLFSYNGVYSIIISSLFIIGFVEIISKYLNYNQSGFTLVTLSISGALVLPTPISFLSILRVRMVYMFTFITGITIGIKRLTRKGTSLSIIFVVCCSLLFISNGFMLSDDLNYSQTINEERAYSQNEISQLSYVAEFSSSYSSSISSTYLIKRTFEPLFGRSIGDVVANRTGLYAEGYILTKDDWPHNQLRTSSTKQNNLTEVFSQSKIRMSESWYNQSIMTGDKIYDSGEVNIISKLTPSVNSTDN